MNKWFLPLHLVVLAVFDRAACIDVHKIPCDEIVIHTVSQAVDCWLCFPSYLSRT